MKIRVEFCKKGCDPSDPKNMSSYRYNSATLWEPVLWHVDSPALKKAFEDLLNGTDGRLNTWDMYYYEEN